MNSGHRFHVPTLHAFIQAVFRQMGSVEQEARLVADHLIAANLAGHDSHGIGMIPSYIRSFSQGHLQINRHAKVVKDAGAVITLDGDCAFGLSVNLYWNLDFIVFHSFLIVFWPCCVEYRIGMSKLFPKFFGNMWSKWS